MVFVRITHSGVPLVPRVMSSAGYFLSLRLLRRTRLPARRNTRHLHARTHTALMQRSGRALLAEPVLQELSRFALLERRGTGRAASA